MLYDYVLCCVLQKCSKISVSYFVANSFRRTRFVKIQIYEHINTFHKALAP